MLQIRRNRKIYEVDGGWFHARWHFSFVLKVIGPEGSDVVKVHQDAAVYVASLSPGTEVTHEIGAGRGAYLYLIDGAASFDGEDVETGDAAKVTHQPGLPIRARERSELILVDVPMQFEAVGIWKGQL